MIRRNVDIIAVAALLFAIALFAQANRVVVLGVSRTHGIRFVPNGPYYRPLIIKRNPPRVPFLRD